MVRGISAADTLTLHSMLKMDEIKVKYNQINQIKCQIRVRSSTKYLIII